MWVRPADSAVLAAAAELAGDASVTADPVAWRDAAVRVALTRAVTAGDDDAVRDLAAGYDALLHRVPCLEAGRVVLRRAPVGGRRGLGAWATGPSAAAGLAAHALPVPSRPGGAVLDPACGAGALLRAAFARLLALGDEPTAAAGRLHGVDVDPLAVELTRAVLAVDVADAGGDAVGLERRVVAADALADPAPLPTWRGGYATVLANPPWERLKVLVAEHPGDPRETLRNRRSGVQELARGLRDSGRFPLTAAGELNAYLLFAELCWQLLDGTGRAALLAPVGLATDAGSGPLLRAVLGAGVLERLEVRANGAPGSAGDDRAVPDLPARDLVALAVLDAGRDPGPATVQVGDGAPWSLDRALLDAVNPFSGTAALAATPRDAALLAGVHQRAGVLLRRAPDGAVLDDPWRARLRTPVHLTRDRRQLATEPGPGRVPLLEAKLAGLLDHRVATWDGVRARPATGAERAEPSWEPRTRWWVDAALVSHRLPEAAARGWTVAFRNTTMAGARRTLLPCAVPIGAAAVANSLPVLDADRLPLLLAALSSLPLDWAARQKIGGKNLSLYKVEQLPVPPPSAYDVPAPWAPGCTVADWVTARLADAVAWSSALAPLAAELGLPGVPAPVDPEARAAARADLDAVHARLLGLSRDDLEHVLGSFAALRAAEVAEHGRYVTAERVLAAFDALSLPVAA